jgi:hypothetical protein
LRLSSLLAHCFVSGYVSTGTLQGGLFGAFSAAVFYGIGTKFQQIQAANGADFKGVFGTGLTGDQFANKVLSHGVAGGVMSRLQGGKFGHGFLSAGVAELSAPMIAGIGNGAQSAAPARVAVAALVGGTVSEVTGGKFGNGALQAAFSAAFNDALHGYTEDAEIGRLVHDRIYENELATNPLPVTRGKVGNMGYLDGYTDLAIDQYIIEIKPESYMLSGYKYAMALDQVQGYVSAAGANRWFKGGEHIMTGARSFEVRTSSLFMNRTYEITILADPHNLNSGLVFYSKRLISQRVRSLWRLPANSNEMAPGVLPGQPQRIPVCVRPGFCR